MGIRRNIAVLILAFSSPLVFAQAAPVSHLAPYHPPISAAQPQLSADERAQVDAAAKAVVASSGIPSASVAMVRNGRIVYTPAYGNARLQPATPATAEMRYSIGSISKQFTAVAMLMLQDEGKLTLDDKVGKWLPDLTRSKDITIRQVLAHTSGYQDFWPEDYVMTSMMQPTTAQHILDAWGKKPLDFEPGTKWQYSNTNYVIAGRIIEIVTGKDLFALLQQRIFAPLGLQSVLNQDSRLLPQTDAEGYYRHALGPLRLAPKEGFGWMFAAGELAMTARDLATWDIAVINSDPHILSAKAWRDFSTEVKLNDGTATRYALGVQVAVMRGHLVIFHSGEVSGFVAENAVIPDLHAAICVLTNLDASSGANELERAVTPIFVPEMRPPVAAKAAEPPQATEPKAAEPDSTPLDAKRAVEREQARGIFLTLQHGRIDRALLTQFTNAYFTSQALDDFAQSLAPLGVPTNFRDVATELRGGMIFHVYVAEFANGKSVEITTYIQPDGKIEQYLVSPS